MPRNPHGVSLGAAPLGVQVGVRVKATVTPPAPAPGGEGARDLVPPPAIVSLGALRDSAALQELLRKKPECQDLLQYQSDKRTRLVELT